MIRAAIFDWDGTLVDTLAHMFSATEFVMAEFGRPITFADYRRHFTPDWKVLYRRLEIPEDAIEPLGRRWWSVYRGQDDAPMLPGAADALARLDEAGITLGLVTGGYRFNVAPQLDRHDVGRLLPVRIYGDDLPITKPDPELLWHALRALATRIDPAEAAYLGDALDDVAMARAAGFRSVGIASVIATEEELLAAGAHEVVPSVATWVDALLAGDRASV